MFKGCDPKKDWVDEKRLEAHTDKSSDTFQFNWGEKKLEAHTDKSSVPPAVAPVMAATVYASRPLRSGGTKSSEKSNSSSCDPDHCHLHGVRVGEAKIHGPAEPSRELWSYLDLSKDVLPEIQLRYHDAIMRYDVWASKFNFPPPQ